ncbi:MAG: phosphotransferase family protein, partial [Ilumatobacteraceae bacterium]
LMTPVEGFNPAMGVPAPFDSDGAWQRRMGESVVDAAAALAALDLDTVGLTDLGRWEGWADRQVGRWRRQLESYSSLDGYGGPDIPGVDDVGRWLDERRPTDLRPGLVHGDLHLGNVLVRREVPTVAALVDWELATVGDPLLDLGHLLATWPTGEGVSIGAALPGLPGRDEVIDRYASATGRSMRDVAWFRVLACYRLGLILEGTHARACAGLAPRATGDLLHAHTVSLFEQALNLIA